VHIDEDSISSFDVKLPRDRQTERETETDRQTNVGCYVASLAEVITYITACWTMSDIKLINVPNVTNVINVNITVNRTMFTTYQWLFVLKSSLVAFLQW